MFIDFSQNGESISDALFLDINIEQKIKEILV